MTEIEKSYEQMYEFENNSRLYDFKFMDTEIPMWMYIRSYFIRDLIEKKTSHQIRKISIEKNKGYKKKGFISKYIIRNPFISSKKDILFAFWSYGALSQHDNGLVYDDLIMPFINMFPNNTITLMNGEILNEYERNCSYINWKMDDIFIDIQSYMNIFKIHQNIGEEDKKNIKNLITFLNHNCPLPINDNLRKEIAHKLENFARNSKQIIKIFEVYLQKINPKLVVICCASYPDLFRTCLILACKNQKIVTAELQHGLISKYHSFYQYSDYILTDNSCGKIFTDYFLTFGNYWSNQAKIPQKCNVIGYTKPVIKEVVPDNNYILFCAGLNFDEYFKFLNRVMPELDESTIIYFRFHPLYSTKKQRNWFEKELKYPNFIIANENELNFYMKKCRYVIVDGSTVCYEALFTGRIVFSFANEENNQFGLSQLQSVHMIKNGDDFLKLWNNRNVLKSEYHKEFFDVNYKRNYIEFLKKCGIDITI